MPGKRLDAIARGHDALWVTDYESSILVCIDVASRRIVVMVPIGMGPHSIEITDQSAWIANHNDDTIMRIDPVTNTVDVTAQAPVGPHQILQHGSELRLVADASCQITEIVPETAQPKGDMLSFGSVRRSLTGGRERLWGILGRCVDRCTDLSITMAATDMGRLYVFERFKGTLTRIENGGTFEPISAGVEIGGFMIVDDELWGVDYLDTDGKVYRIDIVSGDILATIDGGRVSGTPVLAGRLIWVARERNNTIIRIDPATNTIFGSPLPMNRPSAMVADESGVWISGDNSVVHIPSE